MYSYAHLTINSKDNKFIHFIYFFCKMHLKFRKASNIIAIASYSYKQHLEMSHNYSYTYLNDNVDL